MAHSERPDHCALCASRIRKIEIASFSLTHEFIIASCGRTTSTKYPIPIFISAETNNNNNTKALDCSAQRLTLLFLLPLHCLDGQLVDSYKHICKVKFTKGILLRVVVVNHCVHLLRRHPGPARSDFFSLGDHQRLIGVHKRPVVPLQCRAKGCKQRRTLIAVV